MRLTGIGLFVTALAHYIIVHFVYDPAIQDAVVGDGPLGQPRPADDRLADAHASSCSTPSWACAPSIGDYTSGGLRTFLTMLLYLVGIVLFAMGTMVVITLPMPQVPA